MIVLAFAAAIFAFALLGLTDERHGARLLPHGRRWSHRSMRAQAALALTASLALALAGRGFVQGPVLWAGLVMLAAGAMFLSFNFFLRGRQKRP